MRSKPRRAVQRLLEEGRRELLDSGKPAEAGCKAHESVTVDPGNPPTPHLSFFEVRELHDKTDHLLFRQMQRMLELQRLQVELRFELGEPASHRPVVIALRDCPW